jgi:hypothetical protein
MFDRLTPTLRPGKPTLHVLLALTILASAVGAPIAGVAAQPSAESADLVVEQPHYIDGDVSQSAANGTTVYEARGASLTIHPQNFDAERVVNFGTTTGNASLSYDRQTGAFTLTPEQTGTYELYFTAERTVLVDGADNTTANATANETQQTVTRQYRYEARIRVTGGLDLVHRSEGALDETRTAAQNWREFNSTIHQRDLVGGSGLDSSLSEMISWYELRKHPQEALTGGVVGFLILGFTTTAVIVPVIFLGWHTKAISALRRKLQTSEAIKSEEGTAKDAVAELEQREERQAAQTTFWTDLDGVDDQIAQGLREMFGPTVHDGFVEFLPAVMPRVLVRDRLQAMGHDGWVAVVDERDRDGQITGTHLERGADAPADADVVDLAGADDETLSRVRDGLESWDCAPLNEFDLTSVEFDADAVSTEFERLDFDEVAQRLQADMRHFGSNGAFGEYLNEFVDHVMQSPEVDDEGRPDDVRYVMSHFLKVSQRLDGQHNYPVVGWVREEIERSLMDFSADDHASSVIDEIETGAGGD